MMTQTQQPWRLDSAVSRIASEQPDAIAVELQGLSINYAMLEHQSNRIAEKLLADGYGAGHYIAVVARNVAEFAVGCLAVMKCGAAYISLDLRYSHSRIENVLEQGDVSLVLSSYWFPEGLAPNHLPIMREFDVWMVIGESIALPKVEHNDNALAMLCYTSGTTGKPKGVMLTHKGIDGLVYDPEFVPYSKSDRVAQMTTFAFDAITLEVWGSLLNGACLVEVPKSLVTIPHKFQAFLKDNRINSMWMTTSHFNAIALSRPDAFKTLDTLFIGGEAASINSLRAVFESGGAPRRLLNCYGPTEATCIATWHSVTQVDIDNGVIPIGKALQGRYVSVRDEQLQPVVKGEEGELVISGAACSPGYLNNPSLSNKVFIDDPLVAGQTLYRTGDRAKQNEQDDFICLGRNDDQIKVRGLRIQVSAVIGALIDLDAVETAVVLNYTNEADTQEMIAFVTLENPLSENKSKKMVTGESLRAEMASSVQDFMVPSQVHIVEHFPTTDSGKLDRQVLLESVSKFTQSPLRQNCPPRNQLELKVAQIWRKVFSRECSNINQDFYELGGDSLKLIQIIEEIETEFGYGLSIDDLDSPLTIASMAERVSQSELISGPSNGDFLIWMRWWLLPVPEEILKALGKRGSAEILDIPVSVSDVSKTQSFDNIASFLEKRLLDSCPDGPYRLAGYSYTGLLAYELAKRLRDRGKEVELLVLLDSYCGKALLHKRVIRLFKNGIVNWLVRQTKKLADRLLARRPSQIADFKRPEGQFYHSTMASARNHQTGQYKGKTLVVETTDPKAFALPGWKKRLTGDFKVVTIDGDHESIMKRPQQIQKVCNAVKDF